MTQQPYKFNSTGIPDYTNSSSIKLSWNFDNILAKYNDDVLYAKLSYLENKTKNLPFINSIKVDISGYSNDINNYKWINLSEIIINNLDYNIDTYKSIIINKHTSSINNSLQYILSY